MQHNIKPSGEFKAKASLTIQAIIVFVIVYFLLLIAAIALTGLCAYAGIAIIVFKPMLITILIGLGLVLMGLLVLIFLVKFIFHKSKTDLSNLVQIKQSDAPDLFSLIDEVAALVGTNKPKKVYLSNEVNAYVFYDSSFWSMFLPIKKNLTIGVGLMNSVTISEFKAIMAHEFGHFSQRTMKVGSYAYNVNKVLYNMLYDNDPYNLLKQQIAGWHNYIIFFANLATDIVGLIQKILKSLYNDININYLALSREMEFQADEIAASITGSAPMISGLSRIDLANESFQTVLNYYSTKISESIKTEDFFSRHQFALKQLGKEDDLQIINGFPTIQKEDLIKYNRSKLVINDQWASHPSLIDRINAIEILNFPTKDLNAKSAISILNHELVEKMSALIFDSVTYENTPLVDTLDEFSNNFLTARSAFELPKIFEGYYNAKNPQAIDTSSLLPEKSNIDHLFNKEICNKIYGLNATAMDIEVLKKVSEGNSEIFNFEYNGEKYKAIEAEFVIEKIETEKQNLLEQIQVNENRIYQHFLFLENTFGENGKLKNLYSQFLSVDKDFDQSVLIYSKIEEELSFTQNITPLDEIELRLDIIKKNSEVDLKKSIHEKLLNRLYEQVITVEERTELVSYIETEWEYFDGEKYLDDNIIKLNNSIQLFKSILSKAYFYQKNELLNYFVLLNEKDTIN